ncbi:hypothetical protein Hanom_Chr06g00564911 [Helianthus anomalus]
MGGWSKKVKTLFPNYFDHRFSRLVSSSMAPKTSESFEFLLQTYCIRLERHPVMSSKRDTAFPVKDGQITLFADFFKFGNFRLPITKFANRCLTSMLYTYPKRILLVLRNFVTLNMPVLSLGFLSESLVFRALYTLVWKALFFTLDRQSTYEACLRSMPSSC